MNCRLITVSYFAASHSCFAAYVPARESPFAPLVAPLWAKLDKLPPVLIQVGGPAPLSDENEDFARKIEPGGGKAEFILYPNYGYGFLKFLKDKKAFPGAEAALDQGVRWLRGILYSRLPIK